MPYDPNGNLIGQDMVGDVQVSGVPTSGQVITATSSTTAIWSTPTLLTPFPTIQIFSTVGTFNYTPTTGSVRYLRVRLVGGGGSGGSGSTSSSDGGGGGGSGGYIEKWYPMSNNQYVAKVGSGGAGRTTNANGLNGTRSEWQQLQLFSPFATLIDIADFGGAGEGAGNGSGGVGGGVGLNAINTQGTTSATLWMAGGDGNPGDNTNGTHNGGSGGSNPLGQGGQGGTQATAFPAKNSGGVPTGYGSGSGGSSANNSTPNGSSGVVIVEEYY